MKEWFRMKIVWVSVELIFLVKGIEFEKDWEFVISLFNYLIFGGGI